MGFAEALAVGLHSYGSGDCIEFDGVWHSGDDVLRLGTDCDDALRAAGFSVLAVDYRGWGDSAPIVPSEDSIVADAWRPETVTSTFDRR